MGWSFCDRWREHATCNQVNLRVPLIFAFVNRMVPRRKMLNPSDVFFVYDVYKKYLECQSAG